MFSTGLAAGNGTRVTSITRMGDVFLDARVRSTTSSASFQSAQAQNALPDRDELHRARPTSASPPNLQTFWSDWQNVANAPDSSAARTVLLGDAAALASKITAGYRAVDTQWTQLRTTTEANVTAAQHHGARRSPTSTARSARSPSPAGTPTS